MISRSQTGVENQRMRVFQRTLLGCGVVAIAGCATVTQQSSTPAAGSSAPAVSRAAADWPTFGGSNARTNANTAPTRITAANVGSMVRMQVQVSAPIDAGLIYLKGVRVNGATRDVFFGTTNLGRTVAID